MTITLLIYFQYYTLTVMTSHVDGWVGGEGYLHNGLNMDQTNAYIYLNVFISSFNLHFVVVVN